MNRRPCKSRPFLSPSLLGPCLLFCLLCLGSSPLTQGLPLTVDKLFSGIVTLHKRLEHHAIYVIKWRQRRVHGEWSSTSICCHGRPAFTTTAAPLTCRPLIS
ncbi:hypothetical protein BD289DRAFT_432836 [Coniella lustricola]|uniref:Secreted protein n=1 Tax=Coniella lustricola TaxID=2025994 RepID=A0A2T3A982_9PEZI|nr:hypothetical protein BD289DRAFT_432836 [Coniella lustricola]